VLRWESRFRAEDMPIPEGFEDIDAVIETRERDPPRRLALEQARQKLAKKIPAELGTLATLRMGRGWSQKRLAEAIGI
jgi:hypothetical protein